MHEHFTKDEFKCGCGNCDKDIDHINPISLGRLFTARTLAGVPFVITSSIRCATWNHQIGGVEDSSHLTGEAFDIKATDGYTRFKIIEAALNSGFKRIGIAKGFVHVDDDNTKTPQVIWLY